MMLPAFLTAMQDPAIRGRPREIYAWLYQRLDVVQFRPVKLMEIERTLRIRKSSVGGALKTLVDAGYIARAAPAPPDRVWMYRLVHSNPSRQLAIGA